MVSTQSKYDIEYVSGEFGETYTIRIKSDDGSDADLSVYNGAVLTITKQDGTLLFSVAVTISSPNVLWSMTEAQTTAGSSYTGEIKAQVRLTNSTTKKRMTKIYRGWIYKNQTTTP